MPKRPEMATTTIAVYFAGGGLGLRLTGAVLPGMLDAPGPASCGPALREEGVAGALGAGDWATAQISFHERVRAIGRSALKRFVIG